MTPRSLSAAIRIWPWLLGVLLCGTAMMLGYEFGSETASLLGGEPGIWARLGKGCIWGGIVAGLQWPVVRAAGVPPIPFVAGSAVSFAAGYPLGQTVQLAMVQYWGLHWTGYWCGVITFALSLGLPQWWVLRRRLKLASLWILVSLIGWVLTGVVWLSGGRGGFEYGIVTGLGLVWLVRFHRSDLVTNGS